MECSQAAAPNQPAEEKLEIAGIFEKFAGELPLLSVDQSAVVHDIVNCRTPALGGHVHNCDHCGHHINLYNSCLNRHCPKCQSLNQARWLEARRQDLLPVEYFHVVFTIPGELHGLFRANPRLCFNLLFAAVSETLQEVALNPARLGAQIGFVAVLHTWTQRLLYHPHVHCIVPGGGLSPDGSQWISCKPGFFLPVSILSIVFRGKLLSKLEKEIDKGEIQLTDKDLCELLRKAAQPLWMVYSKAPFAGPDQVLRYLGQYTHRIAISNHRLVSLKGREVTIRWKDRVDGNTNKLLTLDAVDFLSRFLMHVMPKGFMRIRHFGFLANAVRKESIDRCRDHLAVTHDRNQIAAQETRVLETFSQLLERLTGIDVTLCPICKTGHLIKKEQIPKTSSKWFLVGKAPSS
jgi:hypothetical protein